MINKKQFKDHLMELLMAAKGNPERVTTAFTEHLKYSSEHYAELDDETKVIVDKQFEEMNKFSREAFIAAKASMPDSKKKRVLMRQYREIEGSHFAIGNLLKNLESEPKIKEGIDSDAHDLFVVQCQAILDFLSDVTENTLKGTDLPIIGLFFAIVEEAYVAFFLARHRYAPQSMGHTRHILEALNLIDLFQKDKSYIDLWASDDWKKKERELSPASVREKLGQDRYDPVYSLLSDMGSHPSFKYIQTKVYISAPEEGKKRRVKINIEGVPREGDFHLIQAYVACILATNSLLHELIRVFEGRLLKEEAIGRIEEVREKFSSFMTKHYYPLMEKFGMQSEIEELAKI